VVHRSMVRTTFGLHQLPLTFPTWKSKVGEGKAVKWPLRWAAKATIGVVRCESDTPVDSATSTGFVKGQDQSGGRQNKAG